MSGNTSFVQTTKKQGEILQHLLNLIHHRYKNLAVYQKLDLNSNVTQLEPIAYLTNDDNIFNANFVIKIGPKTLRIKISEPDYILQDDEVVLRPNTFLEKHSSFIFHINAYPSPRWHRKNIRYVLIVS